MCRKSTARIPAAWACRNCRQVGPDRRGAGSMPAARRISRTVDGATVTPSFVSSPWIRRYPHPRILPRQPDNKASDAPGYWRTARLASAAGVVLPRGQLAVPGQERCRRHGEDTGPAPARKKPGQRGEPHPVSRSYRTRSAQRRSTAFSCRSTSSSASFAPSRRNIRIAGPSTWRTSKYTILSSTRPANHHRARPAADSAGQPLNRVFEWHRSERSTSTTRMPAAVTWRASPAP